jgi:glycosyltransferase involved in cell wall biosynthesis
VPVAIPAEARGAASHPAQQGDHVLCAGRLEPLKNSDLVGRVCAGLGLPLVFAGPGSGLRHLGYARRSLHGASWLGELSYLRLRDAMSVARVHVLASWTEVVGRVSLEAALGGAAVVLSDVGFGPDYLGRGTEGVFLFEPGDEAGLAAAMQAAWARGRKPDSELVDRVAQRYTWDVVGPRLLEAWSA